MITVFGSINIDLVFKSGHLPVPGETVLTAGYDSVPGGKGANQALAARRAGSDVRMVGRVGGDAFAEPALSLLRRDGVDLSGVLPGRMPTGCASVMVDAAGENAIVVASGANGEVSAEQLDDITFGPRDLLVLQMEVPREANWRVLEKAHAEGARIILSVAPAAPVPQDALAGVDVLLVNEIEARTVAEAILDPDIALDDLPRRLAETGDLLCVMTQGGAGALAATRDDEWRVGALAVEQIVDTTGAGDVFAGCLAAALDQAFDIPAALRFAAAGAGLSCGVLGAQTSFPWAEKIRTEMAGVELR
jgi:ribokinase